jgi:hypothetical protein
MTLRIKKTITIDDCIWGKLHPTMFPDGFDKCNTALDGWTLLADIRDPNPDNHIIFWEKIN